MMSDVFITAELGINHNGDIEIVKKLIKMAKDCGCDAVKFQKRTISKCYSQHFLASPRESPWGTTQLEQKMGLELTINDYIQIDWYCNAIGIEWYASAWDLVSLDFLSTFDQIKYNKIASPMLTDKEFVTAVAEQGKKTFISTGMSEWKQIDRVVELFIKKNCPFVLMHTVSCYPAPDNILNLRGIVTLQKRYSRPVGYSGHEVGLASSLIAVVLGATAIERHITLDRAMYGSDQSASLEYDGLKRLVRDIRNVETQLGTGEKAIIPEELKSMKALRWWDDTWDNPRKGQ
jgi:N-acetylneuraminate synthase